jgi:hypothetical protein
LQEETQGSAANDLDQQVSGGASAEALGGVLPEAPGTS